METPQGYVESAALASIPPIDDRSFVLLWPADASGGAGGDVYLAHVDAMGNREVIAFIDMSRGVAYRCDCMAGDACPNPRDAGDEPLVKLVGDIAGDTGQLVIKQPEGHWRRYSRWDRLPKPPATRPHAVVRTLPQCGCGGYLGAPMMFDSFEEMLAYFFVVFSDAQAVNDKHAAILNGDTCCSI
mgnify:CR=1 FL=1